ncbi:adhesion G protein-coupled receptor L4-like isoform X2 [Mercenaria mercenaria]|uniref:adhesion G protein-coupled receptor L4-like isoform X2 n=1 Tax=Mercenaria mercenaria TaxID=6596 RepID=UPI00234FAC0B|nr:adhesion G protein-coupled receptor L4-like isoform X2 [Mercenaria mercenaria]
MYIYTFVEYLCLYTVIFKCWEVTAQPTAATTTCQPSAIVLNISVDTPVGSNENVSISCINWNNRKVYLALRVNVKNVKKYFDIRDHVINGSHYVLFTINSILQVNSWNLIIDAKDQNSKKILNAIPVHIYAFEVNNRPSILPPTFSTAVNENVPLSTAIGDFTLYDPDTGENGELAVYSDDLPEELEIARLTNYTIRVRTRKHLDAEKYNNYNQTEKYIVERSDTGPVIRFTVYVKDKPGLTSALTVNLTITDIGDEDPVCSKKYFEIRTPVKNSGDVIAYLDDTCIGGNYVNKTVSYYLRMDFCSNAFTVESSGKVIVKNVSKNYKECGLVIGVVDATFPQLRVDVYLSIFFLNCLGDTDHMNSHWKGEVSGNKTIRPCPPGYDGIVTRYCDESGTYREPVYYCTSSVIADIYNNVVQGGDNVNVTEALDALANATSGTSMGNSLLIGDLDTVTATLSKITDIITVNITSVNYLTNSFMETANNIIEEKITPTWTVMLHETGSGADRVLQNIDRFVEKIVSTTNDTTVFPKSNLYLRIGSLKECETFINFPDRGTETMPEWANTRQDRLLIQCNNRTFQSFSGVMYRNLSKIMPATTKRSEAMQLNAPVISFTLYPNVKHQLDSPVEIRFQLYNKHFQNASCSFWTQSDSSQGFWSEDGCQQQQQDDQKNGIVVCICNHLTNFAVLMSPSSPSVVVEDHATALSIISITGCVISMVCLFLNVTIHAYFWRVIKSVRSIIHIHLSCSLFLAYILFLTGINRTGNEDVCRAMAALLHLMFLIVFFIMLTEGCHLAYTVIKPLSTRTPGIPMLVLSYVLAVVIVAASMGIVQMEGYGSENVCWLSTENGLIWAFIGPVLAVILINFIVVCMVIRVMCGTTAMSRKSLTERAWAALRGILILMPIMGLTWVFGVFSVNKDTLVFQYLFATLNSLQGLLIFVFHCLMNKKIRDAFRTKRNTWRTSRSAGLSEGPKMKTKDTDL